MKRILIIALFLLLCCPVLMRAENPIKKNIGMSDPHIRIFNNAVYLYCGHDSSPEDKTWVMKEWRVFKTNDLVKWQQVGTISPKDNYMDDNSTDCWAADAIERNGKYYFYFSDRKRSVGVMTARKPEGPFNDALGKPLVSPMHDPTILTDDDYAKTPYLVYGDKEGGGFHIARLNTNMISVAETPKPITIVGKEWEKAPVWMDKNYIFKYNDTYYLSWGRDYAVSKNIYSPYECKGSVGDDHYLNEYAHGSFFWWKGQFYHIWCYYIKQGFKYRESIITYCHIDDNGKIVTDTQFLDQHFENGMGQYSADWDKIEAEWYYEISDGIIKKGTRKDGFSLAEIKNQSWIRYANVTFGQTRKKIKVKTTKVNGSGTIEVRLRSTDGKILGSVSVDNSENGVPFTGELTEAFTGTDDIYLVVKGDDSLNVTIDWINFE